MSYKLQASTLPKSTLIGLKVVLLLLSHNPKIHF